MSVPMIPYRSQWDKDADLKKDDCGAACCAMLAEWRGIDVPINTLSHQSSESGMTTAADLVQNLADIGIQAAIRMLDMGEPAPPGAICLNWYGGFNRENVQDVGFDGWHWMILLKEMPNYVIVHDPDWWEPRRDEGAHHVFSRAEWDAAFIPYPGDAQRTCVALI